MSCVGKEVLSRPCRFLHQKHKAAAPRLRPIADASDALRLKRFVRAVSTQISDPPDGCRPLSQQFTADSIVLVRRSGDARGACTFMQKVLNAQAAGAAGVLVYDNVIEDRMIKMARPNNADDVAIPSAFVPFETVRVDASRSRPPPRRPGALASHRAPRAARAPEPPPPLWKSLPAPC